MSNLVKVNPEDFGVEKSKAKELTTGLTPHLQERKLLIQEFEQIKDLELTKENCQVFKELRLKFRNNRTKGINEWHKTAKEIPLRLGQLIDAVKRNETSVNQTYEEKLEKGEKHFENLEKERLRKLQSERAEMLSKYIDDADERNLSSMDADVWEAYLQTKKQAYNEKIEAEKKAEAERLEKERKENLYRERLEKVRTLGNHFDFDSLNVDTSQKDFDNLFENAKKSKEKAEIEAEKTRKENERLRKEAESEKKKQAKLQAEREAKEAKERKAYEAKLKKEREERERIEAELKAKAEAEARAKAKAEAEKEAELKKGDADKFNDFISDLENLKTKYHFKSKTHQKKYKDASGLIDKIINHIA